MQTLISGKNVFVTGASSGIGKATAERFAAMGLNVIIAVRRIDRIQELSEQWSKKYGVKVMPIELDVQKNNWVEKVFKDLETQGIEVDILVNNAGLALTTDLFQDCQIMNWDRVIDTNLKGLLYVTKACLPMMLKKNRGHIINIGSVAGRGVYSSGNVYCATKHAVRAITQALRLDLMATAIRVTEIAPGVVQTEFSEVRWKDKERADRFYSSFVPLTANDVADAVIYSATRPSHVNIAEITLYPQAQASLTDIYRQGQ